MVAMLTIFAFAGCGTTSDNSATNTTGVVVETTTPVSTTHTVNQEHQLLEQFVAGEVEAGRYDSDSKFKITDLNMNTDEWDAYSVGDYCDLDNDGEDELILNGPYGGMYMDAKDDKVMVLDEGLGAAGEMSTVIYDNATWIVHGDTSHAGRTMYNLKKYEGANNVVDEFDLNAEYYDKADDVYDETSTFTYRDKEITMEEYEKLLKNIFGVEK